MRLIDTGRGEYGRTDYRTQDYRFTVKWTERHGTRSGYTVTDTRADKSLRADNLAEAREAIRELTIASMTDHAKPAVQVGDRLYFVRENTHGERPTYEVMSYCVTQVRIDGWRFEHTGFGRNETHKWSQLDRHYHRSPEAAVEAFVAEKRDAINNARAEIADAERAIAWAVSTAPLRAAKRAAKARTS